MSCHKTMLSITLSNAGIAKVLIRLQECAGWSASLLFSSNNRLGFSQDMGYKEADSLVSSNSI